MLQKINEPLAPYTTYKIGGTCALMLFPEQLDDFYALPSLVGDQLCFWMGGGANILFGNGRFDAVVINMSHWRGIELQETPHGRAAYVRAGTQLAEFVEWVRDHAVADLDYLAGIPGTVGGAVYMNAGAWRRYIEGQIWGAEVYDMTTNQIITLKREDMVFEYRKQKFLRPGQIVLSATLDASRQDSEIGAKIDAIIEKRCGKHPQDPSCGSVFKNPPDQPAGQLIEACGLRGSRVGNAQIAEKHANFIINLGGATFDDVHALILLAQQKVRDKFKITLEPEVRIIPDTSHKLFYRRAG